MSFLTIVEAKLQNALERTTQITEQELIDYLVNDLPILLHQATLCGEHYSLEAELINKKFYNLFLLSQSRVNISWKGPNIEVLKERIQLTSKRYIIPFKNLSDYVTGDLKTFLNGELRKWADYSAYQIFDIQDLAEIVSLPADEISKIVAFQVNISLAYIDENLECSNVLWQNLQRCSQLLTNNSTNPDIISILHDKIEFLQFKIQFRDNHPKPNLTLEDNTYPVLSNSSNRYISFARRAEKHYCQVLNAMEVTNNEQAIQNFSIEEIENWILEPIHSMNRHYKKNSDIYYYQKKANQFLDLIEERIKTQSSPTDFNKVSIKTCENLLRNGILKLKLEQVKNQKFLDIRIQALEFIKYGKNNSDQFLAVLFKELFSFSSEKNNVKDYYSYIIFIEFLNSFIEFCKSEPNTITSTLKSNSSSDMSDIRKRFFQTITSLNKTYKKALRELNKNLEIQEAHKALPLYLSKEECFTEWYFPDGQKLFLRSAYILPNNFGKLKNLVNSWEILIDAQISALQNTFSIELEKLAINYEFENSRTAIKKLTEFDREAKEGLDKFKSDIEEFNKKVKENEFRVVQVVAMFVSIATFVLINVKIFDNKTALESVGIILGLAACFFAFNLFFYLIILHYRNDETPKPGIISRMRRFLLLPTGLAVASILLLLFSNNDPKTKIEEIQARLKQDSATIAHIMSNPMMYVKKDTIYIVDTTK